MDPRPYHFEYRRPRLANPTFESSHLYDSIYQLSHKNYGVNHSEGAPKTKFHYPDNPELKRANSTELTNKKIVDLEGIGTYRYRSDLEGPKKLNSSHLSNYGSSLIRNTSMDQTKVYQKQEKQFNIISLFPKQYKPNLKQFPRLTLEDKIIQQKGHDSHFN